MYLLHKRKSLWLVLCSVFLITIVQSSAQVSDSDMLVMKYGDGQIFSVAGQEFRVKIDIKGFEMTYDGSPSDEVVMTAGHAGRRMITQVTLDTLYTDLDHKAKEYYKLWWYFYAKDTTQQIGALRQWKVGKRHWSTFTILSAYGFEVNEKHYDMFELTDTHSFHVSIKRPLYLEGDSTLMLSILESFEILPPEDSASPGKNTGK